LDHLGHLDWDLSASLLVDCGALLFVGVGNLNTFLKEKCFKISSFSIEKSTIICRFEEKNSLTNFLKLLKSDG
jgi:hypothetical protein